MKTDTFYTVARGKTPEEAFAKAKREVESVYGYDGRMGNIAKESNFKVIIVLPPKWAAQECA
jgi:hypothetical protein